MKIEMKQIKVSDLVKDFSDCDEQGVSGYGGKLHIRPAYEGQRAYDAETRQMIITALQTSFPLNIMYWVKNGDMFDMINGHQRIISICEFINGDYSIKHNNEPLYFHNLTDEQQQVILDYEMMVCVCEGATEWLKTINLTE